VGAILDMDCGRLKCCMGNKNSGSCFGGWDGVIDVFSLLSRLLIKRKNKSYTRHGFTVIVLLPASSCLTGCKNVEKAISNLGEVVNGPRFITIHTKSTCS